MSAEVYALRMLISISFLLFFLNDPAPPEISTFPLPDALPISASPAADRAVFGGASLGLRAASSCLTVGLVLVGLRSILVIALALWAARRRREYASPSSVDRKSTRLNSSHSQISYAVFCLKNNK